ncbi:MAG: SynChlorMet cassette protein ScmD [Deltaproteobacteria bacterium]|nr:SynChlorMet cassette protein ScmD [Deltaproteobacteria bacterium]MBW2151157.1 SynChlorMet cassette protein ScmD [Deltaproteobacteria bacterium]
MNHKKEKIKASPSIVLREEFDDQTLLYDPDTGDTFALNPVGVYIWKLLDGRHTEREIVNATINRFANVPAEAPEHVKAFLGDLKNKGYIE